jgi:hypothetical protein
MAIMTTTGGALGYWTMPVNMPDNEFDRIAKLLRDRYSGKGNWVRTPIIARGDLEFHAISITTRCSYCSTKAGGERINCENCGAPL